MRVVTTLFILAWSMFLAACSQEIVEPETFGSIDGYVINSETNEGIKNASISTAPATEALLTDNKGHFLIKKIPTGAYSINVSKPNVGSNTVNITVRESITTTAKILIEPSKNQSASNDSLEAQVTSWFQTGQSDSSFVEVEYDVKNLSTTTQIKGYDIYFDILSDKGKLLYEVQDSLLRPGERNPGSFRKYVRDAVVNKVEVSGTYVRND